jgi:hypothetical protein
MRFFLISVVFVCLGSIGAVAQDATGDAPELGRISRELQDTRSELAESHRQIEQLHQEVEDLRKQEQAYHSAGNGGLSPAEPSVAAADQDTSFLAAKVAELHQDKVESASKYPVKLSGLVLFNSYWNSGSLDIQDVPSLAFPNSPGPPAGSIGATLRQTLLGIDATGPRIFGAQSSASIAFDFAGGSPTTSYGVTAGLLRLRTASIRLDWKRTSLIVGQDQPFFSPLSPTSYATLLEPALAWSGNLWVWTPQIQIERRFSLSRDSSLVLQGGVLDPLTEQPPPFQGRIPTAGEATRVPAVAGRIAIENSSTSHHRFNIGFGGYRARQRYQGFSSIDSWTLNTDMKVALGNHMEISGEWYDGQAVGGLGGGIWTSVIYPEPGAPYTAILPLRSTGGWAQLKLRLGARFEFNGTFGQDENFGRDLRFFSPPFSEYGFAPLKKNQTDLVNFIFKPNSFLLFAVEYRHLMTIPAAGKGASGNQVNVAAGVHF